jgi:hypothetical protein
MKLKEIKYRVYDSKSNYQQSYSSQLNGGYSWAKDCARRVAGYIVEHRIGEDGNDISSSIVLDLRDK